MHGSAGVANVSGAGMAPASGGARRPAAAADGNAGGTAGTWTAERLYPLHAAGPAAAAGQG